MNKLNNNIINMPYNDLILFINNISNNISLITLESSINNNLENSNICDMKQYFFISKNKKTTILQKASTFYYKKINKKLLKEIKNTDIVISININDSDNDNSIKEMIKNLINLIKIYKKNILIYNIICNNKKYYNYIANTITALQFSSIKKQYEYIYDVTCDELDTIFSKNNYCDFKNNRCIANRKNLSSENIMGCCYSFKYNSVRKYYR